MTRDSSPTKWLGRIARGVKARPRLSGSAAIAVAVFALLRLVVPTLDSTTAALVAWDVGMVVFLVLLAVVILTADADTIRRHAAQQDVGRYFILALTIAAAIASVTGIYKVVMTAADWRLVLAVGTVVLSWFFVQFVFATHYAHEFYEPTAGEPGGLTFPGSPAEPDYRDFLYFALVIGMTSQVSDVAVTARHIRRTVTWHGVFAFFFNVALLALVVSIVADAVQHENAREGLRNPASLAPRSSVATVARKFVREDAAPSLQGNVGVIELPHE